MDRLNQLRGEAGDSQDSTLDTSSPPSEAYMSANESSSKYFSLCDVDSTFSISPSKDNTVCVTSEDSERTTDTEIITNLSPIPKSDTDTYKIGEHIEAANILSGGVNIFDDNENSYDGDELVIDDNVILEEEKTNVDVKLSADVVLPLEKAEDTLTEAMDEVEGIPSKDTEVVLQIDGKNVDAIDIGNGLYLYRKVGQDELAAVQIIDDDQHQPSFKFLKVRENTEGNLEVYEEIEIEIPKEVSTKDENTNEKNPNVAIKNISKEINEPSCNKIIDKINTIPKIESNSSCTLASEPNLDLQTDSKSEVNRNGKKVKFNESRKSPIIGTFTPMTYHSTPNRDGIPLTKTMVDLHLHPSRHSDNIKKTIEVHTDSSKPKSLEIPVKTIDPDPTAKIEELDSSIQATKGNISKSPAAELKIDTEITTQNSSNEVKCNASDQTKKNSEDKSDNAVTIKSTVYKKEYIVRNSDEHQPNAEQKVQCINETRAPYLSEEKQKAKDICSTLTHDTTLPSTLNMKSIQCHEKILDSLKETSRNENHDIESSTINATESDENKSEKNININNKKDQVTGNLVIPENSEQKIVENKDVVLPNEPVSDDKLIGKLPLKPFNNDDVFQLKDTIVNHDTSNNPLMPSSPNVTPTFAVNAIQNTNEKEIKKDDLIIKQTLTSKLISEADTNKERSNTALDVSKNKLDNSENALKTNIETRFEGDDSGVILTDNENDNLKSRDLHVADNDFHKEVIAVNSIKKQAYMSTHTENPISLVMTQKHVPELPATNNSDINLLKNVESSPSEFDPKNTITTQFFPNDKHIETRKEVSIGKFTAARPNSYNSTVPFGKWTEANRQEFLNKIKETKVHSNNSNTNQIKQTNDLNRRDILKKFDSQRNSMTAVPTKSSELGVVPKFTNKMDTATFVNKSATTQQSNPPNSKTSSSKTQTALIKHKPLITKKPVRPEPINTELLVQRKVINSQDLIDKTIEGIITRTLKLKPVADYMKEQNTIHTVENPKNTLPLPGSLDDIEMKMNELHGISFIERPVKELPQNYSHDLKTYNNSGNLNINKNSKVPKLLPFKSKESQHEILETKQDDMSDEEIIEHEPITGDIDNSKQNLITLLSSKEKPITESKKDTIITEKDFDQFARRNSKNFENCLTVSFDSKEQHNAVQSVVEKEISAKKMSRNELMLAESKAKSSNKHSTANRHNNQHSKIPILKSISDDDLYTKNHQSKVQIAYQSALDHKISQKEYPFTIIEDKPVKVVFMDTNTEYIPTHLNIQGQNLSPSKGPKSEPDSFVHSASESMDSDILDGSSESKLHDETKVKAKHQRKQVLTPVEEEPEIQLIEPSDIENKIATKKRRIEDKHDKYSKNLVPKKSYLLNRSSIVEERATKADLPKSIFKETDNRNDTFMARSNAISAIDNLVKAAELIETQSENETSSIMTSQPSEIAHDTPVKRGRGRPRKYPLPESGSDANKTLSPQKKPRLIDAKVTKPYIDSDESSDGAQIKENWTMGKINENIVCPICYKLFRTENVVFKHVKHCTGPSPNRSDSDKRSPRRLRNSQESDRKLRDSGSDDSESEEEKLCISKSNYNVSKSIDDSDDIIIIEDKSAKENVDKKVNCSESKKVLRNTKHQPSIKNHICEFCGKTFRQLSYLVSHKLQHTTQDTKKKDIPNKSVFSCEICKKEFRKQHHLVQHRIIHNPRNIASRTIRKSSLEHQENKNSKTQNDDASAGYRCSPCDKSFRKLHHLVEHRETHDGIKKKCSTSNTQGVLDTSKSSIVHHCDICKKVFKKLQDFVDHKEVHYETSSEKSDDKSVKSSLSTKDIIHECSLCYMVFPNEHSLNKHTVICLRKKKQSAAKQAAKKAAEAESESTENQNIAENTPQIIDVNINPQIEDPEVTEQPTRISENVLQDNQPEGKVEDIEDKIAKDQFEENKRGIEPNPSNLDIMPKKRNSNVEKVRSTNDIVEIPAKIKKVEEKQHTAIPDPPITKKKISKDKANLTVNEHATTNVGLSVSESSDENEIRYMLNPIFDDEQSMERKKFMKIRGLKRNSFLLERPKSKDLLKRRISLLHPPKIPRLKARPIDIKPRYGASVENNFDLPTTETAASTDSDDSDVKYSFPEVVKPETSSIQMDKKVKRKSLTTVAKRKSLGKMTTNKPTNKPRKRTTEVEHRCDCGQLFSSEALLSRHTTLAHTPPRIRKRRSPPPDTQTNTKPSTIKPSTTKPGPSKQPTTKPAAKPAQRPTNIPKTNALSKKPKSVTNSNNRNVGVATRKSSVNNEKASNDVKCEFNSKSLRSSKRVVPESARTLADKPK